MSANPSAASRAREGIPTMHNGVLYRSRLEARWAIFMDALGVRHVHEPCIFQFPSGLRYCPDFFLPLLGVWLEIKPDDLPDDETEITRRKVTGLAATTQQAVYVLQGHVGCDAARYMLVGQSIVRSTGWRWQSVGGTYGIDRALSADLDPSIERAIQMAIRKRFPNV